MNCSWDCIVKAQVVMDPINNAAELVSGRSRSKLGSLILFLGCIRLVTQKKWLAVSQSAWRSGGYIGRGMKEPKPSFRDPQCSDSSVPLNIASGLITVDHS